MMTNSPIDLTKPFRVFEAELHDELYDKTVATFDHRWEAEEYVDEHEGKYFRGGYCLMIEGEDE